MVTTTDMLLGRIENIENSVKEIESVLKQILNENAKDKQLENFRRFN
jgi:hypothetical protein